MNSKLQARNKVASISKRSLSSAFDRPVWSNKTIFDLEPEDRSTVLRAHGKVLSGISRICSYLNGYPEGIDVTYTIGELTQFVEDVNTLYDKLSLMHPEIASLYCKPYKSVALKNRRKSRADRPRDCARGNLSVNAWFRQLWVEHQLSRHRKAS